MTEYQIIWLAERCSLGFDICVFKEFTSAEEALAWGLAEAVAADRIVVKGETENGWKVLARANA